MAEVIMEREAVGGYRTCYSGGRDPGTLYRKGFNKIFLHEGHSWIRNMLPYTINFALLFQKFS